jgi:hypothetical protein
MKQVSETSVDLQCSLFIVSTSLFQGRRTAARDEGSAAAPNRGAGKATCMHSSIILKLISRKQLALGNGSGSLKAQHSRGANVGCPLPSSGQMQPTGTSETLAPMYQTTRRHSSPGDIPPSKCQPLQTVTVTRDASTSRVKKGPFFPSVGRSTNRLRYFAKRYAGLYSCFWLALGVQT